MAAGKKAAPDLDTPKKMTAIITEGQRRRMREYVGREGMTLQDLMIESLTEYLAKRGVKL